MLNKLRQTLFFLLLGLPLHAQWITSPVPHSPPVNQLRAHGNACGPACLLDSMRSGSTKWQASVSGLEGNTDSEKIQSLVNRFGIRPSHLNPKLPRWTYKNGINAIDLIKVANEMRSSGWMGTVRQELFLGQSKQSPSRLLAASHQKLKKSFKKGLPPILSLKRSSLRKISGSPQAQLQQSQWVTLKRHFVVLTAIPKKLTKNATSYPVTYHDPWGGKDCQGVIRAEIDADGQALLIADFPEFTVGRKLVRRGEKSRVTFSSAIGVF